MYGPMHHTERDFTRTLVVIQRPGQRVLHLASVADPYQRFRHGAKVAHPKKVKMPQAGAIEVFIPQPIHDLLRNFACIAIEVLIVGKVAVKNLPKLCAESAKYTTDASCKFFHWLQYST